MPDYLIKFAKFLGTRVVVFYLCCFLIVWKILDYHQLVNNAVPQTMSRLTPPVDYFAEFIDKEGQYDQVKLMDCINYHQAVTQFFPFQKAEGYGMLGFCYERLGQEAQAIDSYQKSITSNPDYFWPYFDLGVLFYNRGHYTQAEDYLQEAIDQNPLKTLVLLSRSKVYNDVKLSSLKYIYDPLEGLKQGRLDAYMLMMDSLYKTASYPKLGEIALEGFKEDLGHRGVFYYYLGVCAFYQKSLARAVNFLQASLQERPDNADAYYYLGLCLRLMGRQDMSQALFNKAAVLHQQGSSIITPQMARVRFF